MRRRTIFVITLFFCSALVAIGATQWNRIASLAVVGVTRKTVGERLTQFEPTVRARIEADFRQAGVPYPPKQLTFYALKDKKVLHVYARNASSKPWSFIKSYPVLGASGTTGPKFKEGDKQVPEGVYAAESLNPNSLFHLSIRVNYPNALDRAQAKAESRTNLGGDIMIHGSNKSVGCLAMGDPAAEDLFILVARAGVRNTRILIAPWDLTRSAPPEAFSKDSFGKKRYAQLLKEVKKLPAAR